MKNRPQSISASDFAIAFLLLLVIACSDQPLTTAAMPPTPLSPRLVEYSDHFYQGSDAYYWWDGQPPPGDLSPAVISVAEAFGMAPRPGTQGWVEGRMAFIGDQAKLDVSYSVDSLGHAIYSNAIASSGWKFRDFRTRGETQTFWFSQPLGINGLCDFSLQVGGTAYARKAFPFGISLSLIKFSVAVTFGTMTWGEASMPLQAQSDPGWSCDFPFPDSECDQQSTPEVEYCPVSGDPANSPYGGGGGPSDVVGDYGGHSSPGGFVGGGSYCVDWIDWWVSFDGGQTWHYDYRQCTQWQQM